MSVQLSENMSNIINAATGNIGNISQPQGEVQREDTASGQLKNLLAGDIFSGEIIKSENGGVLIDIGNGKPIFASLLGQTVANAGDSLMFMVESKNSEQISLKIMDKNSQEMTMISKALAAAGMSENDTTVNIVKSLIDNTMPIDKKSIMQMSRYVMNHPDTSTDTIARLIKLGIPVTEEAVRQFDAYREGSNKITETLDNITEQFSKIMSDMAEGGHSFEALKLFSDAAEALMGENSKDITGENTGVDDAAGNKDNVLNAGKDGKTGNDGNGINADNKTDTGNMQKTDTQVSLKDFIDNLMKQVKSGELSHQDAKKIIASGVLDEKFNQLIDKLRTTPKQLSDKEEAVRSIQRLHDRAAAMEKALSDLGQGTGQLAKSAAALKESLNFMNDLSRNMTFMQIPLKLNERNSQADLYVYTNKKNLLKHPDNVSALLHLDMEHLGPTDVYVTMSGKKVNTNFRLESEEMLDFVCDHIDILNERIEKLGYDFKFTVNLNEKDEKTGRPKESVSFTDDFLDKALPNIDVKSYLFDSRA